MKDDEKILNALVKAFEIEEIEELVQYDLDVSLDEIAGQGNKRNRIFELINWARRRGLLEKLVSAAAERRPNIEQIQELVKSKSDAGVHAPAKIQLPTKLQVSDQLDDLNHDEIILLAAKLNVGIANSATRSVAIAGVLNWASNEERLQLLNSLLNPK